MAIDLFGAQGLDPKALEGVQDRIARTIRIGDELAGLTRLEGLEVLANVAARVLTAGAAGAVSPEAVDEGLALLTNYARSTAGVYLAVRDRIAQAAAPEPNAPGSSSVQ